jgi:hypothetical protein
VMPKSPKEKASKCACQEVKMELPSNPEAERMVVGCAMLDSGLILTWYLT